MNLYAVHNIVLRFYWWLSYLATFAYLCCVLWHHKRRAASDSCMPSRDRKVRTRNMSIVFITWNVGLAIFSAIGTLQTAPRVWGFIRNHGMTSFLCEDPFKTVGEGDWARWSFLFVCSKYIELLDTAFLIWRNKNVSFLHYYHHSTVLVFVWRAFIVKLSSGMIFTSINYFVHAFMYVYYAQATITAERPTWGKCVTALQLMQMLLGLAATAWHIVVGAMQSGCRSDMLTLKCGMLLYVSYFGLFVHFSLGRHFTKVPLPGHPLPTARKDD
uniref:Very-long-chain 3-oxoacyl-CoA synthase n=1 Tax=viral metagenome TaxID=1070528 RepID=A0A6C0C1J3_9ZZZZ